jgi:hypothetical protein
MLIDRLGCLCKTRAKHFIVLGIGIALVWGSFQGVAMATARSSDVGVTPVWQLGLAASSRFAAQAESENLEPTISEAKLDEMREQRREWQSEVSAAAAAESEVEKSSQDSVKDKLNLDEITRNNSITEDQSSR